MVDIVMYIALKWIWFRLVADLLSSLVIEMSERIAGKKLPELAESEKIEGRVSNGAERDGKHEETQTSVRPRVLDRDLKFSSCPQQQQPVGKKEFF
jgi:hypothetical protein